MLLQSRGSRLGDVLTLRDVEEIAESPPGAVQDAVTKKIQEEIKEMAGSATKPPIASTGSEGSKVQHASVSQGKPESEKPS